MPRFRRNPTVAEQFRKTWEAKKELDNATVSHTIGFHKPPVTQKDYIPVIFDRNKFSTTSTPSSSNPVTTSGTAPPGSSIPGAITTPGNYVLKLNRLYRLQFAHNLSNYLLVRITEGVFQDIQDLNTQHGNASKCEISICTKTAEGAFEVPLKNSLKNSSSVGGGVEDSPAAGTSPIAAATTLVSDDDNMISSDDSEPTNSGVSSSSCSSSGAHQSAVSLGKTNSGGLGRTNSNSLTKTSSTELPVRPMKQKANKSNVTVTMQSNPGAALQQLTELQIELVLITEAEEKNYLLENIEVTLTGRKQMSKRDMWNYGRDVLYGPVFYKGFKPSKSQHIMESLVTNADLPKPSTKSFTGGGFTGLGGGLATGGSAALTGLVVGGAPLGGTGIGAGKSLAHRVPVGELMGRTSAGGISNASGAKWGSSSPNNNINAPSHSLTPAANTPANACLTPGVNNTAAGTNLTSTAPPKLVCGLVGPATQISFRSLSADIFLYIEISKELFNDFTVCGHLLYEEVLDFVKQTIDKQKAKCCDHEVTLVLFGRSDRMIGESMEPTSTSGITTGTRDWFDVVWCGPVSLIPPTSHFIAALRERLEMYNPKNLPKSSERKDSSATNMNPERDAAGNFSGGGGGNNRSSREKIYRVGQDHVGRDGNSGENNSRKQSRKGTASKISNATELNAGSNSAVAVGNATGNTQKTSGRPISRFGSLTSFGSDRCPTSKGSSKDCSDYSDEEGGLFTEKTVDTHYFREAELAGSCKNLPFLEALNLAVDSLEHHTLDRQLTITGQAIFVLTANHGVIYARRDLCDLTRRRFNNAGIRVFLVCFREKPLHRVPLVLVPKQQNQGGANFMPDSFDGQGGSLVPSNSMGSLVGQQSPRLGQQSPRNDLLGVIQEESSRKSGTVSQIAGKNTSGTSLLHSMANGVGKTTSMHTPSSQHFQLADSLQSALNATLPTGSFGTSMGGSAGYNNHNVGPYNNPNMGPHSMGSNSGHGNLMGASLGSVVAALSPDTPSSGETLREAGGSISLKAASREAAGAQAGSGGRTTKTNSFEKTPPLVHKQPLEVGKQHGRMAGSQHDPYNLAGDFVSCLRTGAASYEGVPTAGVIKSHLQPQQPGSLQQMGSLAGNGVQNPPLQFSNAFGNASSSTILSNATATSRSRNSYYLNDPTQLQVQRGFPQHPEIANSHFMTQTPSRYADTSLAQTQYTNYTSCSRGTDQLGRTHGGHSNPGARDALQRSGSSLSQQYSQSQGNRGSGGGGLSLESRRFEHLYEEVEPTWFAVVYYPEGHYYPDGALFERYSSLNYISKMKRARVYTSKTQKSRRRKDRRSEQDANCMSPGFEHLQEDEDAQVTLKAELMQRGVDSTPHSSAEFVDSSQQHSSGEFGGCTTGAENREFGGGSENLVDLGTSSKDMNCEARGLPESSRDFKTCIDKDDTVPMMSASEAKMELDGGTNLEISTNVEISTKLADIDLETQMTMSEGVSTEFQANTNSTFPPQHEERISNISQSMPAQNTISAMAIEALFRPEHNNLSSHGFTNRHGFSHVGNSRGNFRLNGPNRNGKVSEFYDVIDRFQDSPCMSPVTIPGSQNYGWASPGRMSPGRLSPSPRFRYKTSSKGEPMFRLRPPSTPWNYYLQCKVEYGNLMQEIKEVIQRHNNFGMECMQQQFRHNNNGIVNERDGVMNFSIEQYLRHYYTGIHKIQRIPRWAEMVCTLEVSDNMGNVVRKMVIDASVLDNSIIKDLKVGSGPPALKDDNKRKNSIASKSIRDASSLNVKRQRSASATHSATTTRTRDVMRGGGSVNGGATGPGSIVEDLCRGAATGAGNRNPLTSITGQSGEIHQTTAGGDLLYDARGIPIGRRSGHTTGRISQTSTLTDTSSVIAITTWPRGKCAGYYNSVGRNSVNRHKLETMFEPLPDYMKGTDSAPETSSPNQNQNGSVQNQNGKTGHIVMVKKSPSNQKSSPVSKPKGSPKASPTSQGKPASTSQGKPSPTSSQGKPSPSSQGKPSPGLQGKPSPTSSQGKPSPTSQGKPSPTSQGKPSSSSQGKPSPTSQGKPSPTSQGKPSTSSPSSASKEKTSCISKENAPSKGNSQESPENIRKNIASTTTRQGNIESSTTSSPSKKISEVGHGHANTIGGLARNTKSLAPPTTGRSSTKPMPESDSRVYYDGRGYYSSSTGRFHAPSHSSTTAALESYLRTNRKISPFMRQPNYIGTVFDRGRENSRKSRDGRDKHTVTKNMNVNMNVAIEYLPGFHPMNASSFGHGANTNNIINTGNIMLPYGKKTPFLSGGVGNSATILSGMNGVMGTPGGGNGRGEVGMMGIIGNGELSMNADMRKHSHHSSMMMQSSGNSSNIKRFSGIMSAVPGMDHRQVVGSYISNSGVATLGAMPGIGYHHHLDKSDSPSIDQLMRNFHSVGSSFPRTLSMINMPSSARAMPTGGYTAPGLPSHVSGAQSAHPSQIANIIPNHASFRSKKGSLADLHFTSSSSQGSLGAGAGTQDGAQQVGNTKSSPPLNNLSHSNLSPVPRNKSNLPMSSVANPNVLNSSPSGQLVNALQSNAGIPNLSSHTIGGLCTTDTVSHTIGGLGTGGMSSGTTMGVIIPNQMSQMSSTGPGSSNQVSSACPSNRTYYPRLYTNREELEENERWNATRFELTDENPSWSKKAKILSLNALWTVLESPPLLPIFVERKKNKDLGRKSDNWSCVAPLDATDTVRGGMKKPEAVLQQQKETQLYHDLIGMRLLVGMQIFHSSTSGDCYGMKNNSGPMSNSGGSGGLGVGLVGCSSGGGLGGGSPDSTGTTSGTTMSKNEYRVGGALSKNVILCNHEYNYEITLLGEQINITQHEKWPSDNSYSILKRIAQMMSLNLEKKWSCMQGSSLGGGGIIPNTSNLLQTISHMSTNNLSMGQNLAKNLVGSIPYTTNVNTILSNQLLVNTDSCPGSSGGQGGQQVALQGGQQVAVGRPHYTQSSPSFFPGNVMGSGINVMITSGNAMASNNANASYASLCSSNQSSRVQLSQPYLVSTSSGAQLVKQTRRKRRSNKMGLPNDDIIFGNVGNVSPANSYTASLESMTSEEEDESQNGLGATTGQNRRLGATTNRVVGSNGIGVPKKTSNTSLDRPSVEDRPSNSEGQHSADIGGNAFAFPYTYVLRRKILIPRVCALQKKGRAGKSTTQNNLLNNQAGVNNTSTMPTTSGNAHTMFQAQKRLSNSSLHPSASEESLSMVVPGERGSDARGVTPGVTPSIDFRATRNLDGRSVDARTTIQKHEIVAASIIRPETPEINNKDSPRSIIRVNSEDLDYFGVQKASETPNVKASSNIDIMGRPETPVKDTKDTKPRLFPNTYEGHDSSNKGSAIGSAISSVNSSKDKTENLIIEGRKSFIGGFGSAANSTASIMAQTDSANNEEDSELTAHTSAVLAAVASGRPIGVEMVKALENLVNTSRAGLSYIGEVNRTFDLASGEGLANQNCIANPSLDAALLNGLPGMMNGTFYKQVQSVQVQQGIPITVENGGFECSPRKDEIVDSNFQFACSPRGGASGNGGLVNGGKVIQNETIEDKPWSPSSALDHNQTDETWSSFDRCGWVIQRRLFTPADPLPWNLLDQIVSQAMPLPAATPYPLAGPAANRAEKVRENIRVSDTIVDRVSDIDNNSSIINGSLAANTEVKNDAIVEREDSADMKLLISSSPKRDDKPYGGSKITTNTNFLSSNINNMSTNTQEIPWWRLRSVLRSIVFVLVPIDESRREKRQVKEGVTIGSTPFLDSEMTDQDLMYAQDFYNFKKALEQYLNKTLDIRTFFSMQEKRIFYKKMHRILYENNPNNYDENNTSNCCYYHETPIRSTIKVSMKDLEVFQNRSGEDWLQMHFDNCYDPRDVFHLSIEWILCNNQCLWTLVEGICRIANENRLQFLSIPHSQLFPQPSLTASLWVQDPELVFKRSPFFNRVRFKIPSRISYDQLLEHLMAVPLNLVLVYHHPEDLNYNKEHYNKSNNSVSLNPSWNNPSWIMMEPSWILMEPREALFFISITKNNIYWTESKYYGRKPTKPLTTSGIITQNNPSSNNINSGTVVGNVLGRDLKSDFTNTSLIQTPSFGGSISGTASSLGGGNATASPLGGVVTSSTSSGRTASFGGSTLPPIGSNYPTTGNNMLNNASNVVIGNSQETNNMVIRNSQIMGPQGTGPVIVGPSTGTSNPKARRMSPTSVFHSSVPAPGGSSARSMNETTSLTVSSGTNTNTTSGTRNVGNVVSNDQLLVNERRSERLDSSRGTLTTGTLIVSEKFGMKDHPRPRQGDLNPMHFYERKMESCFNKFKQILQNLKSEKLTLKMEQC